MKADNYTLEKIEALKYIAKVEAEAYAKRNVPSTVMVMGGESGEANLDAQTEAFMSSNLVKSMKALNTNLDTK